MAESGMKTCCKCGGAKSLRFFYLNADRPMGYSARCRSCHGVQSRSCSTCGKEFEGLSGKRFCSEACRKVARPRRTANCKVCAEVFLAGSAGQKFCSVACKIADQTTGRRRLFISSFAARAAHSRVAYALKTGIICRPVCCEDCGKGGRVQAAHFDYSKPLEVRWLCRSCHVRWDKAEPKGGGHSIVLPTSMVAA